MSGLALMNRQKKAILSEIKKKGYEIGANTIPWKLSK